jgi:pre-rRNA-processing protein TSR3
LPVPVLKMTEPLQPLPIQASAASSWSRFSSNGNLIADIAGGTQELKSRANKNFNDHATLDIAVKPLVYMLRQDDPFKCTAAKLAKFHLAEPVKFIRRNSILLNPFLQTSVSKKDAEIADSVCAIDCSWERADEVLKHQRLAFQGIGRRLPAMLAANPTNYAKLGKLSSAEALAGALHILGEKKLAAEIMDKFKWGHTFLELNANLLMDYAGAETEEQIALLEKEYFPQLA